VYNYLQIDITLPSDVNVGIYWYILLPILETSDKALQKWKNCYFIKEKNVFVLNARFLSDLNVHFEHACISIHPRVVLKSAERHREFMTSVTRTCISCGGSCCKFFCFPTHIKSRLSRLKKYINRFLTTQHSHFWCTIFVFRASLRPQMFHL